MIMVGDRASDVEAAQAIGCPFIGCDYGHGYREEIDGAGPIIATFAELPGAIHQLGL
jgi:phosphoglycolate phosphatase-like HAD superfamily hydrolase